MRTPRTLPLMGFCTHRLFRFVLFLTVSLQVQLLAAQKPVITSFTPAKGPIGTAIVISGANFSTVPANNTVFFGDVRGVVTSASSNELTVVAPAGASYKPLTVTTNGLTTYATKPFILTFQGGSGGFTSYSFPERLDSLFEVNPAALAASDLDGDGQPDLVVTNRSANQVTIRRNTGNPGKISFAPRLQFPTGNSPAGIAIADLDGDGKADIVVANSSGNTLSVLKNKSVVDTISFFPKIDLAAGSLPFYCAIGDVDGDGKPDILCTNAVSNTLSVFRNTSSAGNLQFSPKIDFPTGSDPAGLTLVDLDGDGVQEIAVANENGASISVYRNRSTAGTILLDTKVDFANTFRPTTLFAADMDDDGKTDLVAGSGNAAVFTVVKNRTAGGNLLLDPAVHFPTGHGASQTISLGDVDGDGKIDVAANHYLYTQVSLIRNESVADTLRFSARRDYTASDITTQALLADLDLDGRPDLLTANGNGSVSTFRNVITKPYVTSFTPTTAGHGAVVTINGGNFSETSAVSIGGSPVKSFVVESPEKILAVVDTGASGDVVVTTTYGSGKLPGFSYSRVPTIQSFTPTNGQGGTVVTLQGTNFTGATTVLFDGQPAASFQVLSPTFIQATAPPLAAGSYDVKVTTPFGTATKPGFYTGVTINSFFPTTGASGTIVTIQGTNFSPVPANNLVLFGTIKATVVAANTTTLQVVAPTGTSYAPITVTTDQLTAYSNHPFVTTFRGTDNRLTSASFNRRLDSATGSYPIHATIADLNLDGRPDVIVSNFASHYLSVSRNTTTNNHPSFATRKDFATTEYPVSTSVADFDGDGKPDVFLLTTQTGSSMQRSCVIFRNTFSGDSINLTPSVYALGILNENPEHSAIADFDGDGKPDVVVMGYGTLSVLRNTSLPGAISFAPKIDLYDISLARSLHLTDVDGDGKPDIIVANSINERLSVFRNISAHGQILFSRGVYIQTGFGSESISFGDMDSDGKPDVVISHRGSNRIAIQRNISSAGVVAFEAGVSVPLGTLLTNLALNDLDGDGRLDIVVSTGDSRKSVTALRNLSMPGTLNFADPVEYLNNWNLNKVFLADITGDGKPDLLTTNPNGTNFSVFVNQVTEDQRPQAPVTALTPTEFCDGDSVVLKTPSVSGATYQWFREEAGLTAATDSFFTAKVSGRYAVHVTQNGSVSTSAPVVVSKKELPAVPQISPAGSPGFCEQAGLLLRSSAPYQNQWYRNEVPVADNADSSLYISTAGSYKVSVTSNGCVAFSSPVTINRKQTPDPIVVAPDLAVCPGDSLKLTAMQTNGATLQWNLNEEPMYGATDLQLSVRKAGAYSVTVHENGCTAITKAVVVSEKPAPAKPSITQNGSELRSSSASGNQWYRNGIAVTDATAQVYAPTNNGNYTVQVTQNGCKSPMSDQQAFVTTGILQISNDQYVRLGPNPVKTAIRLEFQLGSTVVVDVDLIDLSGRVINRWQMLRSGAVLECAMFANGTYFIKLNSRSKPLNVVLKLVKQ